MQLLVFPPFLAKPPFCLWFGHFQGFERASISAQCVPPRLGSPHVAPPPEGLNSPLYGWWNRRAMQLAAQGLMTDSALERLGHWEKGSKMPRHYDSEACVTELQTRKTVTSAYRGGWRPASDGSMPAPATPAMGTLVSPTTPAAAPTAPMAAPQLEKAEQAGSEPVSGTAVKVFNTQRRKYHLVVPPNVKSRCFFWTCGTAEKPASNADFNYGGHGHQCVKCFFR